MHAKLVVLLRFILDLNNATLLNCFTKLMKKFLRDPWAWPLSRCVTFNLKQMFKIIRQRRLLLIWDK